MCSVRFKQRKPQRIVEKRRAPHSRDGVDSGTSVQNNDRDSDSLNLVMVTDFGPKYVVFRDIRYAVTSYKSKEICPHDDD